MVTTTTYLAALARTRDVRKAERENVLALIKTPTETEERRAPTRPVTVYRVEHKKTRIGPYNHERDNVDDVMRLTDKPAEPGTHQPTARFDLPGIERFFARMAEEDGVDPFLVSLFGYPMGNIRFGFDALAPLRAWFGDSFVRLSQAGYVIGVYRVQPGGVFKGNNQVAYHTGYATRVGELAFTDAMQSVPLLPKAA